MRAEKQMEAVLPLIPSWRVPASVARSLLKNQFSRSRSDPQLQIAYHADVPRQAVLGGIVLAPRQPRSIMRAT
jgi:hypothetical protein